MNPLCKSGALLQNVPVNAKKKDPNYTIHMGRLFGICVQKGAELPPGDKRQKYKYRVVFQGNQVVTQNWEVAPFQDLGSSPATMVARPSKLTRLFDRAS